MFADLLKKTINLLRTGKNTENPQLIIDINRPCLIPDYYMEDIFQRLKYYQRISLCKSEDELLSIRDELIDIFGPVPDYLENLLLLRKLKSKIGDKMITYMKIIDSNVTIDYQPNKKNYKKLHKDDNESKVRIKMSLQNEDFERQCIEIQNNLNNLI